eukprot:6465544-Amphidinium_carterae.1
MADMYKQLETRNPGAAGTCFEQLVHIFWLEKIQDIPRTTDVKHVKLELRSKYPTEVLSEDEEDVVEEIVVDFSDFKKDELSLESFDVPVEIVDPSVDEDALALAMTLARVKASLIDDTCGYFIPGVPSYPGLDSILRFRLPGVEPELKRRRIGKGPKGLEGRTQAIAIQVSLKRDGHSHAVPTHNSLLTDEVLALWDMRPLKPFYWKPDDSETRALKYIRCKEFEERLRKVSILPEQASRSQKSLRPRAHEGVVLLTRVISKSTKCQCSVN